MDKLLDNSQKNSVISLLFHAFYILERDFAQKKRTNSVSSTASRYVSEALFTNFYQNRNLIKTNEKQLVCTISP